MFRNVVRACKGVRSDIQNYHADEYRSKTAEFMPVGMQKVKARMCKRGLFGWTGASTRSVTHRTRQLYRESLLPCRDFSLLGYKKKHKDWEA